MTRETLISELIGTLQDVLNFVDLQEEKAKGIFAENQLDLVDEIWFSYPNFKEKTLEELQDWFEQLEEMHYMY
ncbi:hypothetical protein [Pseudotamlana agarivorans]|uniref:hypothetical protein n=1 Tax=Pseudotamlana agarivorans TaxID=481183 RepID=UPI000833BD81|nr:hypothetical protein [Tamlana agarivorans]